MSRATATAGWRRPAILLAAGSLAATVAFGTAAASGARYDRAHGKLSGHSGKPQLHAARRRYRAR